MLTDEQKQQVITISTLSYPIYQRFRNDRDAYVKAIAGLSKLLGMNLIQAGEFLRICLEAFDQARELEANELSRN